MWASRQFKSHVYTCKHTQTHAQTEMHTHAMPADHFVFKPRHKCLKQLRVSRAKEKENNSTRLIHLLHGADATSDRIGVIHYCHQPIAGQFTSQQPMNDDNNNNATTPRDQISHNSMSQTPSRSNAAMCDDALRFGIRSSNDRVDSASQSTCLAANHDRSNH